MISRPFNANGPACVKATGFPTVEQAFAGGASAEFTQLGVMTSGGPVTTASVFARLAQPIKFCELPIAAFTNVADWLADRNSGLPAGSKKLFTAKPTIRAERPAETLLTDVFVSVTNASAPLPGALLISVTPVTEYPPTLP